MEQMNEKEALSVIEKMIVTARQDAKDNGFYFMLWGWLVLIGALSDYVMLVLMDKEYHAISWAILMPLGGIVSMIAGFLENKKKPKVSSYTEDIMMYLIRAFGISMLIVCPALSFVGEAWKVLFPILMILYAILLYVTGGALKFKPLIIGGMVNWTLATVAFFQPYDIQLILLAVAVLVGYIVPGHMLKARFKEDV